MVPAILIALIIGLASPTWAGLAEGEAAIGRGDYPAAFREFLPLAKQGDAVAQLLLGGMYVSGQGVPQNYAEAVKWYRLSAAQGNRAAQSDLGLMYAEGKGVPQNYAEAFKWLQLSAARGDALAQHRISIMYALGRGVPQDYVLAHMWMNLAASDLPQGKERDDAISNRDLIEKKMTPTQVAEAQRRAREWKPQNK